jgi:hypothetical protein
MYERLTESVTWYIIFDECHIGRWWSKLLHPKFGHVHLWRQAGEQSILVNPLSHAMCVRHCDQTIDAAIQNEIASGCTAVLGFTVHYGSFYRPKPLEFLTCISIAKRILCINKSTTPKQLYHELIKAGAQVIKPFTIP